ncbi:dihydropteroate synthase [Azospirillum sp. TSH100]|uniref:DUF6513 domain-containing protein n=1 Tax=Azospirillum sp. TSH100 TaxID=652764 RepID=UPI000D61153B|nr:DUF6513 domain-containing protein [Azospirillum sp. TSH100]PWC87438.1 dihydropteroate synthase [Azospirillum sp. TSH100]QCG89767.1 dihydropteroate synthase [Azospirillum sp. TSH100]
MSDQLVFLTGKLAEPRLRAVLDGMASAPFRFDVVQIGVSVAALMTEELIKRRLPPPPAGSRVILPGRTRCDLAALSGHFGVAFERGPEELRDIPAYLGGKAVRADLSHHAVTIFAEIIDAPHRSIDTLLETAARLRRDGADVIDLGCHPGERFEGLEAAVAALVAAGHSVSVDSADPEELLRGASAGASYLLSLSEDTLWVLDRTDATPILVPAKPRDLDSLGRAIDLLRADGRRFLADPVLDPIHYGFTESVVRYQELRRRYPDIEMLMGIGNLTELTDADTTGTTALLMGMVSELSIGAVLTLQVSPHARTAVREADRARRIMHAAAESGSLPKGIDDGLMALRDRRPYAGTPAEIAETARNIRDPSFRIEVAEDGVHVYNRDGHHVATDPYRLYPLLGLAEDGGHAFYMGVELQKAFLAWQLGKRYVQDEDLTWGCAVEAAAEADGDAHGFKTAGTTLQERRRACGKAS